MVRYTLNRDRASLRVNTPIQYSTITEKRARSRVGPVDEQYQEDQHKNLGLRKYKHLGTAKDNLYKADYLHLKAGPSCDECGCDPSKRVQRPTDDDDDESYTAVRRGTIASGEPVVKDAELRDNLAKAYGFLCFEMEAADALVNFPCIFIFGISDYCDLHKNDQWHGYAAAAAVAYAG